MKKITHFVTILIIIQLLVNCSTQKKVDADSHTLYLQLPKSGEDTLKASYFADTVIYIPLEATPESYIRYTQQLFTDDSFFYVNCAFGGLFQFQRNGKFIRKIGKTGHGPGEYTNIRNLCVIDDTVYIASAGKSSFICYTTGGEFCHEIKLNYNPVYFNSTADHKLACYVPQKGIVLVYNKNLNSPDTVTVEYGVTDGRYKVFSIDPHNMYYFQKTATGLLFNSYRSDTIWNVTGNIKEPAFILNLHDKLLPYDKQSEFFNQDMEAWRKMVEPYQAVNIIPHTSYVLVLQRQINDGKLNAIYLNNNKTGEAKKFDTWFIYDDIVGKTKLNMIYPIYYSDYIVTMGSWKTVREMIESGEEFKVAPSSLWIEQMKSIDEEANPIIVLLKVKKEL